MTKFFNQPLSVKSYIKFVLPSVMSIITILASGFFTAVGNGRISALIACLNSLVLTLGFVAVLPRYLNITGGYPSIWPKPPPWPCPSVFL